MLIISIKYLILLKIIIPSIMAYITFNLVLNIYFNYKKYILVQNTTKIFNMFDLLIQNTLLYIYEFFTISSYLILNTEVVKIYFNKNIKKDYKNKSYTPFYSIYFEFGEFSKVKNNNNFIKYLITILLLNLNEVSWSINLIKKINTCYKYYWNIATVGFKEGDILKERVMNDINYMSHIKFNHVYNNMVEIGRFYNQKEGYIAALNRIKLEFLKEFWPFNNFKIFSVRSYFWYMCYIINIILISINNRF